MSQEPYLLITADTHAGGSHAQYRECLDPKWREPFDAWRGGYKNPSQEHYGSKKMRNWDLGIRTADQNSQGVVGEVVFPNTVPPFYSKSIVTAHPPRPEDYERCLAGIRAHNRWLKDFCAEDPARRAGIGVILPNDLDEAVKDIEFIAKAGLRGGVLLPLIPPDATWLKPLYDPAWDRVYAAIQDHGLVMNQHTGQGLQEYGQGAVAESIWIQDVTFYGQSGWRHLLMAGVFEKFPRLKHILTESGCSWVPAALKSVDRAYYAIKAGATGEMNYAGMESPLKEPPSEYAKRHCYYGASFPSMADLAGIEQIGEDHVLWGNDYPHYEGTFPYNLESLRLTFGGMPDARRRKVLGLNAAALYDFDLEKLMPLAAKYGPTPAEVETPLPLSDIPRDATCYLFREALM
ncbi:MAG TPA: amidohydrolase family protein, partial [Caulobacteraceae bacterium]|nr:amidohydrolase family protein [Caulobacteraceae bacterium]